MDDTTVKALLTAAGVVAGGLIGAGANAYAARQKLRELELSYTYKIRDGYLENARKVAGEVYIPINIALTKLSRAYDLFRTKIDFDTNDAPQGARNAFIGQCRAYLSEVDELFARGADAYLTNEIDAAIRRFNSFLRASLTETGVTTKVVLEAGISFAFFGLAMSPFRSQIEIRSNTRLPKLDVNLPSALGLRLTLAPEVLSAAIQTRHFEKRIQIDLVEIRALIKEVVLGSR